MEVEEECAGCLDAAEGLHAVRDGAVLHRNDCREFVWSELVDAFLDVELDDVVDKVLASGVEGCAEFIGILYASRTRDRFDVEGDVFQNIQKVGTFGIDEGANLLEDFLPVAGGVHLGEEVFPGIGI